ncbi:MAG: aminoglycoside 6'-N-acetyltransferase [Acidobacteriaceae bacterium]
MSGGFRIEAPTALTLPAWQRMRQALWPELVEEENRRETEAMLTDDSRFFVRIAVETEGNPAGFAEASLRRDYVNGCATSPVVFLEGIYVEPHVRRQGAAHALVSAVEAWARQMGCSELGSDALLDNDDSHAMHRRLGFAETERVVYFCKDLGS